MSRSGESDDWGEVARVARHLRETTSHLEAGSDTVRKGLDHLDQDVDDALRRAEAALEAEGLSLPPALSDVTPVGPETPVSVPTWDELLRDAGDEEATLDDLLPAEVAQQFERELGRPLDRTPWDRIDAAVVTGAALLGIVTDVFCAPLGNPLSEHLRSYATEMHDKEGVHKAFRAFQKRLKHSALAQHSAWLQHLADIKVTDKGLPIDFRARGMAEGDGAGWAYHRVLSGGHDLLRFMSGIWQIKNGQFVVTEYEYGRAVTKIVGIHPNGTPYEQREEWLVATVEWLLHMAADFFTKTSLPVPGSTLLGELPNREIRTFVREMYYGNNPWDGSNKGKPGDPAGGYNLRHVVGQSTTTFVVHTVLWLYDVLRYRVGPWVARWRHGTPLPEPEAVPGLKRMEMAAVAHALVAGVNTGKVLVAQNPLLFNLPQFTTAGWAVGRLTLAQRRRYDLAARVERNDAALDDRWAELETWADEVVWPEGTLVIGASSVVR